MALTCACRKKNRNAASASRHAIANPPLLLTGTNLQGGFPAFLAPLLPSGVVLPGTPNPLNTSTGFSLSPNTSNNPEPALTPKFTGLSWSTPSQIWGNQAGLFIVDHGERNAVDFTDVNQGAIGDCWMMAAIAALAGYGVMPSGTTVIQQAFTAINPPGNNPNTVTINLYPPDNNNFGRTTNSFPQTIDTKIPVASNNQPVFVKSDCPGEFWPCMMEKAVAAALTTNRGGTTAVGYPALVGGFTSVGMSFFTPGVAALYSLSTKPTGLQLFTAWDAVMASGITVGVSWIPNPGAGVASGGEAYGYYGLVSGHAYTVYSTINAGGYRLGLLRNPWGTGTCAYNQQSNSGEWTGAWSDCSPQWAANPLVKAACGFTGPRADGLFWMSFDDIATYMNNYELFIPSRADMRATDLRPSPFNPCNPVPGYMALSGMDYSGNDIRQVASTDPNVIAAACNSTPQCLGFNNYGYLKSAQPALNPIPNLCYYVKNGTAPSPSPTPTPTPTPATVTVTFKTNTAFNSGNIGWSIAKTNINYPPGSFPNSFQSYTTSAPLAPGQYTVNAVGGVLGWNGATLQILAGSQQLLAPSTYWLGPSSTFTFTVPAS